MANLLKKVVLLIPETNSNVEDRLSKTLAREVEIYSNNLTGTKCFLCPFRVLSRFSSLRNHLKYHTIKSSYIADIRSPQLNVVRAIFDYRLAIDPISNEDVDTPDLLSLSATLIAK